MNAASPFFRDGRQFPTLKRFADALDDFAELLSEDLPLNECAARMEVTVGTACVLFVAMCERLGWQSQ
jgi:hypothetical protein